MESLLRTLSTSCLEETGAEVGERTDVDASDVSRKAFEALARKGWSVAQCNAALGATEAAAAADRALSFNEQRKQRLARALEHLVLYTPEAEQPAEYRRSSGKPAASGRLAKKEAAADEPEQPATAPSSAPLDAARALAAAWPWPPAAIAAALQASRGALQPALATLLDSAAPSEEQARAAAAAAPCPATAAQLDAQRAAEVQAAVEAWKRDEGGMRSLAGLGDASCSTARDELCLPVDLGCGVGTLRLSLARRPFYPFQPPAVAVECAGAPAEAVAAAAAACAAEALTQLGAPMLRALVEWVLEGGAAAAATAGCVAATGDDQDQLLAEESDEEADAAGAEQSPSLAPRGPKLARRTHEEVAALRRGAAVEVERLRAERNAAHAAEDAAEAAVHEERMRSAAAQAEARAQKGGAEGEARRMGEALTAYVNSTAARPMLSVRASLPAAKARDSLVAAISRHQIVLVVGATGSGKTTQIPQYILDDAICRGCGADVKIVCTQPRRVAATSVATRVAAERGEKLGVSVGYKVRLDAVGGDARLLFATTGILLRRLNDDPALAGVSHVLVDEAHERSLDNDLLLALLRDLLPRRPSLKLVLMSATLDSDVFSAYFRLPKEAVLFVPGVTHPVTELFLEDCVARTGYCPPPGAPEMAGKPAVPPAEEAAVLRRAGYSDAVCRVVPFVVQDKVNYPLLAMVLQHICSDESLPLGGILVFLPGLMEIQKAREVALAQPAVRSATGDGRYLVALHSALGSVEQAQAFASVPAGLRKLVLATNIAETSVTIEDVVHVVDTGRLKETGYEVSTGMPTLKEAWVSAASAQQRRGRAGRVRPGLCWRLFSRSTHAAFAKFALPEIQRVPLVGALLSATALRSGGPGGASALLSRAPSPPDRATLNAAAAALVHLGAMDSRLRLTVLGTRLAALPLDPRVGKMLIFASLLRCLGPALTVAAVFGGRSLFVSPLDKRDEADAAKAAFAGETCSDHVAAVRAFDAWLLARREGRGAEERFVRDGYLSKRGLQEVADSRRQFAALLSEAGLLGSRRGRSSGGGSPEERDHGVEASVWAVANENAGDLRLLAALLVAGLAPNVARVEPPAKAGAGAKQGATKLTCRLPPDETEAAAPPPRRGVAPPAKLREAACALHPGCIAYGAKLPQRYVVFLEAVRSSSIFLRDCTPVTPYALLLFGGELSVRGDSVIVDGWAAFKATPRIAVMLRALRTRLNGLLLSRVATPQAEAETTSVLKALKALLSSEAAVAA